MPGCMFVKRKRPAGCAGRLRERYARKNCTCNVTAVKYAVRQSGLAVAQQPSPVVEAG